MKEKVKTVVCRLMWCINCSCSQRRHSVVSAEKEKSQIFLPHPLEILLSIHIDFSLYHFIHPSMCPFTLPSFPYCCRFIKKILLWKNKESKACFTSEVMSPFGLSCWQSFCHVMLFLRSDGVFLLITALNSNIVWSCLLRIIINFVVKSN